MYISLSLPYDLSKNYEFTSMGGCGGKECKENGGKDKDGKERKDKDKDGKDGKDTRENNQIINNDLVKDIGYGFFFSPRINIEVDLPRKGEFESTSQEINQLPTIKV